jgi:hypothetical protein
LDAESAEKAARLVNALISDGASDRQAATEVAQAQLEMMRIRGARAAMMAKINLTSGNIDDLQRLVALDRYEQVVHTRRRRASYRL